MKKLLLIILVTSVLKGSYAQDIHFSQFHQAPLTINPAMTGFFEGKYRVALNYRNQWGAVHSKYETYGGSFDMNFLRCKSKNDYIGVGVDFYRDKAGDLGLYTNQIGLSLAYSRSFGYHTRHSIAIGAQGNFYMKGIDMSKAIYPDGIDEAASVNSANIIDVDAGILYHVVFKKRVNAYLGFSYGHITTPEYSLQGNAKERIHPKFTTTFGSVIEVGNNWNILPNVMYRKQGPSQEIMVGSYFQYIIGDDYFSRTAVAIGAWGRFARPAADAFILGARADIKWAIIGVSYDFNLSELKTASKGRGAIEASVVLQIPDNCRKKFKGDFCPTF